jgi:nicotinamide phosphoribosyltransferase
MRFNGDALLSYNLVLDADSYKLAHSILYPNNAIGMFSYVEPRVDGDVMIPFGLQMWAQKTLTQRVTKKMVDEAERFAPLHFGRQIFDRRPWDYMIDRYGGYLPVVVRGVPEGTRIPSKNIVASVECTERKLYWLSSYLETTLQRGVWYPTSIASNDYDNKKVIQRYYNETSDNPAGAEFALHDFGGRGVTCEEQAQIGGAAHLISFKGSDTISGIRAANWYYKCEMAGFSVPATEHSIQSAYGPNNQRGYIKAVLDAYAVPGAIVSIVLDGYNIFRETKLLATEFKNQIVESGARIVVRPDSGNCLEVVPEVLQSLSDGFGYTVNSKGYKVLNTVGVIQGDGIDSFMIDRLYARITSLGWAADNLVLGSGGGLLQKVNRDTYKFAQKATSLLLDTGIWVDLFKDPITDPGKKSKAGRLTLVRSVKTGEYLTLNMNDLIDGEFEDQMQVVYEKGEFLNWTTLDDVRYRAAA